MADSAAARSAGCRCAVGGGCGHVGIDADAADRVVLAMPLSVLKFRTWFNLLLLMMAAIALPSPLAAQSCTADVQCRDGGISRTYCSGNAVVTARSICVGTCRTVEESRIPCDGQCLAGRCLGAPSRAPVDGAAGKQPWPRCAETCRCRNKTLVITTGLWTPEAGCEQKILRCSRGCSCDPPRCR